MPEAAGTPARPGLADSAAGKEFGTARTAPHSTERGERSTSHSGRKRGGVRTTGVAGDREPQREPVVDRADRAVSLLDRKSTRLNSSHLGISYAVFCLKKKNARRSEAVRH